jgi:hypothetical protein
MSYLRTHSTSRLRAAVTALVWNVRMLDNTMNERTKVQKSIRTVSDEWVFHRIMGRKSFINQMLDYLLTPQAAR